MVDFQSRNTRRGLDEEPSDADPSDDRPEGADSEAPADADTDDTTESPSRVGTVAVLATSGAGTDVSDAVADALEAEGYTVRGRDRSVRDFDAIQATVTEFLDHEAVCAIVTVGGTGVGPEDRTVEAVRHLFTKALPGVGEAFRREWAGENGRSAIASRVVGGVADDTPVFSLPGTPEAATFATRELVAPEAAAIHREAAGR